jgi:integrase
MTIVWNPKTGNAEADLRLNGRRRLHVSLKTKKVGEANDRYAAVKAAYLEGNSEIEDALRSRKFTPESLVRVHRAKKPFESLLEAARWPTLKEAVDKYLTWIEQQTDKAEATHTSAKLNLNQAIEYFGAGKRLDAISHDDVEAWKLSILERKLPGANAENATVSPWTAAMQLTRLNALYSWVKRQEERRAARENRSPRPLTSPVDREIIPKKNAPRQRFLSKEEAQRLLASTPESLKFPILAGLLGGLRIGEVLSLRPPPQDLNFDVAGGIIMIQEKVLSDGGRWRPKSKKRREVPIAAELLTAATHHVAEYGSSAWMVPSAEDPDQPMGMTTLQHAFVRIVKDAGLISGRRHPAGVTFHTLRHTFASWLVMAGVDLWTVAQLLGHSGIKQVEQTYAHLSPNHQRLAVDRLGTAYKLELETPEASQ